MIRVLVTADAVGGVWQYAIELAWALLPFGVEPIIAVMGPTPSRTQMAAATGLTVIDTGLALDWLADDAATVERSGAKIAALASELGVDLVHIDAPALAATALFDVPVVAVAHSCVGTWWEAVRDGPLPAGLDWQACLTRAGLLAADVVVAPSAAFAAALQARHALPRKPRVVHNGRGTGPASHWPMADAAFTAGRLWDDGKNVAVLDAAAARLAALRPAVRLLAAGPVVGPNGSQIDLHHVHALGVLSDATLGDYLAGRPVFVSASRYEPFGLAVLEAAAAGCALVLSDIPTFRELWDGVARFVPVDDDRGYASAISALIADRPARIAAGRAAAERAGSFTPAAMAGAMADIYRRLLATSVAAA